MSTLAFVTLTSLLLSSVTAAPIQRDEKLYETDLYYTNTYDRSRPLPTYYEKDFERRPKYDKDLYHEEDLKYTDLYDPEHYESTDRHKTYKEEYYPTGTYKHEPTQYESEHEPKHDEKDDDEWKVEPIHRGTPTEHYSPAETKHYSPSETEYWPEAPKYDSKHETPKYICYEPGQDFPWNEYYEWKSGKHPNPSADFKDLYSSVTETATSTDSAPLERATVTVPLLNGEEVEVPVLEPVEDPEAVEQITDPALDPGAGVSDPALDPGAGVSDPALDPGADAISDPALDVQLVPVGATVPVRR